MRRLGLLTCRFDGPPNIVHPVRVSAGLMPYRRRSALEVLVAHPGGPLWAKKDAGHWTIVKGEVIPGEDPKDAAAREFQEETSWVAPQGDWLDLGSVRLKSGKTVLGWAVEADLDPGGLNPGLFSMVWHGRRQDFPEIDRVAWCSPEEAQRLLNPAQGEFILRLIRALTV